MRSDHYIQIIIITDTPSDRCSVCFNGKTKYHLMEGEKNKKNTLAFAHTKKNFPGQRGPTANAFFFH